MSLKRFALITSSHEGSALAYRAKREGMDVLTGVFQDWNMTYTPEEAKVDNAPEEPLEKERRMKNFNGMVPQVTPQKLLKTLGKLSLNDQQETFLMTDMNYNFKFSGDILAYLNVHGNFPLLEDRVLESDREAGKEFVKEYYTDLQLTEVHDYNNVQEALDFLEENMGQGDQAKLWVLKGNDAGAETIVPLNDDTAEQAYQTIKTALEKDPKIYEGKGFILEEFIKDAIEITPQCIFYNGVPILYSVDIEIKKKGSGLSGRTTGCAANLVFRTSPDDKINKMAFPPIIYQMAKQRRGLFIWDASVLCNPEDGEYYFGEFCCNRFGYDCTQTEMELAGGVTSYFDKVVKGEAPYDYGKFGFAVRVFNELDDKEVPGHVSSGVPFFVDKTVSDHVWPLYVYEDEEGLKSSGYGEDLAIITSTGNTIEEAAGKCYEYMKKIGFKDYSRLSLDDVLSRRVAGTILNRFDYGNGKLYNVLNGDNLPPGDNKSGIIKEEPMELEFPTTHKELNSMETPATNMRGVLDMVTSVMNENDQLKKKYLDKISQMEKDFERKMAEYTQNMRTEMAVKFSNPQQQEKQNKQIELMSLQVGSIVQEFKAAVNAINTVNNSVANISTLDSGLKAIQQGLKPLEQASYWVKISDRLSSVESLLSETLKFQKQPKGDVNTHLVKMFNELKKEFTDNTDRMIKSSKETITVVGGGNKPTVTGTFVNVSYDYVALSGYDGNNNPSTVVYKAGGANGNTVAKLALTYDGSGNVLTVTKQY